MLAQGSLPGFDPGIPTDRLFLAIFPDSAYATRFEAFATRHLAARGMQGKPVDASRLHVTLFHLGDYLLGDCMAFPQGLVERAVEALARLKMQPSTIRFDRIGSFGHRGSHGDFVLAAGDGNEALHSLRQQLAAHLHACALNQFTKGSFTPHMTLAYNRPTVPFQPIEPVVWPAHEVVLIHSVLGKKRHIRLADMPLHG